MESGKLETIRDSDFRAFARLLETEAGIQLPPQKKALLQSRVAKVLRARGIADYRAYFELIVNDTSRTELVSFINLMSTNVTHFFREHKHFDFMREVWWPSLPADGPARIWSAACSSGEEVYSIAITLEELTLGKRGYSILGTDISTRVLEAAKRGIYPQPRPDNVPPETLHRWFQRGKASATGYVRVKSSLKSHVRFERVNLMEPIPFPERFHLVFCRNVMIYFNTSDKESLVNRLAQRLLPGGYLMIGHSESLNGLTHPFSYIAPAIYRLDSHE